MPDNRLNNLYFRLFVLFLCFHCSGHGGIYAQSVNQDSVDVRPLPVPSDSDLPRPPTNNKLPRDAFFRSAILPGWGQWYNRQKWKTLLAIGGEAGFAGAAIWQNQLCHKSPGPEYSETYPEQNRLYHSVLRDQSVGLLIGSVVYSMLDAYTDAYQAKNSGEKKSRKIAVLRSLLVPGGGYHYTGAKFKSWLTMSAGVGLLGGTVWHNQRMYQPQSELESDDEIRHQRNFHKTRRNNYLTGFAGLILFSAADAYTEVILSDYPPTKKSPRVAVIRSILFPGWGQWYNQKKFKALLVFGTEVGFASAAIWHNQRFVKDLNASGYTEQQKEAYREFHLDGRNRYVWYLGGTLLYSMADAYVDAHLFDFDEGPELTLGFFNGKNGDFADPGLRLTLSKRF